jgi:hypothetical protein
MQSIHNYGITSDHTLREICNELGIKLSFIGFEDELITKNIPYEDGGYILNIGNDTGSHWVCFNAMDKQVLYFDSFAVPPSNEVILYLNSKKIDNLIWNSIEEFQQLDEQLCGLWCIVALWYMQEKKGTMISRFLEMTYDF